MREKSDKKIRFLQEMKLKRAKAKTRERELRKWD